MRDNNDENAWWFPVTSHSSAMNDVTFNFGTYPMFRNMCEKAREVNEGFLARAKKIYGDDDDDDDDDDAINKGLFACLHAPFTRSSLHVDVSSSNSENRKRGDVEDELRRVFLRPIKKLVSAISTNECPITNKKDIHILFWQLLRTYFDSTFRWTNFCRRIIIMMIVDVNMGRRRQHQWSKSVLFALESRRDESKEGSVLPCVVCS